MKSTNIFFICLWRFVIRYFILRKYDLSINIYYTYVREITIAYALSDFYQETIFTDNTKTFFLTCTICTGLIRWMGYSNLRMEKINPQYDYFSNAIRLLWRGIFPLQFSHWLFLKNTRAITGIFRYPTAIFKSRILLLQQHCFVLRSNSIIRTVSFEYISFQKYRSGKTLNYKRKEI